MLLGVVFIAVGLESAIEHAFEPLGLREAVAISGGVFFFLAGNVAFRRILGIGSGITRTVIAVVALCTIPLSFLSATIHLVSLVLLFVTGFFIETKMNK